ncbi:MAG: Calx-beta domain-containing protein, partial [Rubripirellula sp.]
MSDSTKVLAVTHPAFGSSTGRVGTRTVRISDWEPSKDWRFGWGASTGAANDRHILEDVYVRDTTANVSPEVSDIGSSGTFTDGGSLPAFRWRVRDYNANATSVVITLQKSEGGQWVSKRSQTTNVSPSVKRYVDSDTHTLQLTTRDLERYGLGVYRSFVRANDGTGLARTATSRSVTVNDDDTQAPQIATFLDGLQVVDGDHIELEHDQVSNLQWTVSDSNTGNSGVSSATSELWRDGELVVSSNSVSDSFDLSNVGPGSYTFRSVAFDADRDRDIAGTTDLSGTEQVFSLVLRNTAPVLRLGTDQTIVQGQPITLAPLEVTDANGDDVDLAWSFDGGGTFVDANPIVRVFDDVGTYEVIVKAEDEYGAGTTETLDVFVTNAPPFIDAIEGEARFDEGEAVSLQVRASDGPAETLTYGVDWDSDGLIDETNATGQFSTVLGSGIHVPEFFVTDNLGLTNATSYAVLVGAEVPNPPSVTISSELASVDEGQSGAVLLTLSEASTSDVAIQIGVSGDIDQSDYELSDSVLIIPAGETTATFDFTSKLDGVDELDESFELSITSALGGTLDSAQKVSLQIIDTDPTPRAWFVGGDLQTEEVDRNLRLGVQLSNPSSRDLRIPIFASGNATQAVDYQLSDTEVLVPAGQLFGAIDLAIVDDSIPEVLETVLLQLQATTEVQLSSDPSLTTNKLLRIESNDAPSLGFSQLYQAVSEADGTVTLTATLTDAPATVVTASALVGGNADLIGNPEFLEFVFQPGETSASVDVGIVDDQVPELLSFLVADFVTVEGATLGPGRRTVAEVQDDDFATLQFVSLGKTLTESSTSFQVEVKLDKVLPETTTFPITLRGGNARLGSDFLIQGASSARIELTIPAGETSASFEIEIIEDSQIEPNESFVLGLGQPRNEFGEAGTAVIGSRNQFRTVIRNDDASVVVRGVNRTVTEGQGSIDITVGLSSPMDERVDVTLVLRGTADPGSEVKFDDGARKTIPFFPGETSKGLKLFIVDDDRGGEPVEYAEVVVQAPIPVSGPRRRLTITDTDELNARFASGDSRRFENEGTIRIPIRLNGTSNQETVVLIKDPRRSEPDLVTIPAGVEEIIYEAPLNDNGGFDVTQHILFRLVAGVGVNVDPKQTHDAIVYDDEADDARDRPWYDGRRLDYTRWVNGRSLDAWIDDVGNPASLLGFEGFEAEKRFFQRLGDATVSLATTIIEDLISDPIGNLINDGACDLIGVAAEAGAFV